MEFAGIAIASLAAGLAVGVLSGMLGVGGGTVLVPLYRLVYQMEPIVSTATSLFTIIPTSLAGALTRIRARTCVVGVGLAAGLGGALTSPVGVHLATLSPDWAIMLAAAAAIGYSATTMLAKALRPSVHDAAGSGPAVSEEAGTLAEGEGAARKALPAKRQVVVGALIGMVAGLASGYVGLGGGFIMVPLMMRFLNAPLKLVSGTSLIAVAMLALPAAAYQMMLGNVDWLAGICVACGSIPGATLGARLASRVPERTLRLLFSAFLFVGAALLVVKQLGVL